MTPKRTWRRCSAVIQQDWRYGDLGEFQEGLAATMAADRYISSGGTDTSSGVREKQRGAIPGPAVGRPPTHIPGRAGGCGCADAGGRQWFARYAPCWAWEAPNAAWSSIYPWPQGDGSARMSPHVTDAITTYDYAETSRSHVDLTRDVDELRGPVHGHRARRAGH